MGATKGNSNFNEIDTEVGVNANVGSISEVLDMRDNKICAFFVKGDSGSHTNHVTTLQCSPIAGAVDFINTSSSLTGLGVKDNIEVTARFVRLKITTPEGSASTINWDLQAK